MSLPAIDIPIQLPFEVPLLIHPVFVHFAVAIPVIVLLIELVNMKARNRAVSVTSLFLLTLVMLVYVGVYFTGKADGSEAFALLSAEAKEELSAHKLLGTYLVYATAVLFVFKILAMLIKKSNWARDLFLVFLLIFIGLTFKQGKDGGELVYEYGVNVKAVTQLQDKIDEMEDLEKAEESAPAEESAVPAEPQEAVPAEGEAHEAPAATGHESAPAEETHEAVPAAESHEAAPAAESVEEAAHEAVQEAAEAVEEKAEEATEAAQEAAHEAEEAAHEATEAANVATEAATEAVEHTAPADSSEHEAPAGH